MATEVKDHESHENKDQHLKAELIKLHSVKSVWMSNKELAEFTDKVNKLKADVTKSKPEDYTQDTRNDVDGLEAHYHQLKNIAVDEAVALEEQKKLRNPDYKAKKLVEVQEEVSKGVYERVDSRTVAEVVAQESSRHLIDPSYTPKTQKQVEADRLKLGIQPVLPIV